MRLGQRALTVLWLCTVVFALARPAGALEPAEVVVVANRNAANSVPLARFYMQKRHIPAANLAVLRTVTNEACTRREYNLHIATPLRRFLENFPNSGHIRCLVLMSGMPLKIRASDVNRTQRLEMLQKVVRQLTAKKAKLPSGSNTQSTQLRRNLEKVRSEIAALHTLTDQAAVDSEISLVRAGRYPLQGWVPNPFFYGFRHKEFSIITKEQVLMVSRLDGPIPKIVRRMVTDSLQAEKKGLSGIAYFDARYKMPPKRPASGYALYDYSIHQAARFIRKMRILPVVVEDTPALFAPGQCPKAALYCGWYSLGKYIDAFAWQKGAVGYHIASSECATLRRKDSRVWCKMMLAKGAAATIGSVYEPYVQAFPLPEIFFTYLTDGYLSLAECYLVSLPYLSWQMVLAGDPLYRPFAKRHGGSIQH